MEKKLDSTGLFVTQVENHVGELGGLLSIQSQATIEKRTIERVVLSTNMLASSASLLELEGWEAFLSAFEGLLITYRDRGLPWDERLAQITSEIIEKEEQLIAPAPGKSPRRLSDAVANEELGAVLQELVELQAVIASAPHPAEPASSPEPTAPAAARAAPPTDAAAPRTAEPPLQATDFPEEFDLDRALGRSMGDLSRNIRGLLTQWEAARWDIGSDVPREVEGIRTGLFLVDFYARSIEQMIHALARDRSPLTIDSLSPVRSIIEDFARVLCADSGRRMDIHFVGEDNTIDAPLLFPVVKVIQSMIRDVFARCDDEYLHVEISAEERHGSLFWSLRDNGSNFITDSQLDRDECLAFYPGLKQSSKVLFELQSLLCVEPHENQDTRFSFTTPVSIDERRFVLWGDESERMAVHSSQVSDIVAAENIEVKNDARGEFVMKDGKRVPLVRLGQVYTSAPGEGASIAIIGSLEKRIAFYVRDSGRIEVGDWVPDAVPMWKGMTHGVVKMDGKKVPLVDADGLVKRYIGIINSVGHGDGSGGIGEDENDLSQTQAAEEKDVSPPPDNIPDVDSSAEVLVVERSEALRSGFAAILAEARLKALVVDQLEVAIDCLDRVTPSVIISEFRVPSMAAKVLVERLKAQGKSIPVLVTTTHQGESAELLVAKLGVAGYIGKPLNPDEVLNRLGRYFPRRLESAQKR